MDINKKIKPIQYYYVQTNPKNEINNIKYVLPDYKSNSEELSTLINVDPKKFANLTTNPLNHIKNKWFVNLTDITIPPTVSALL